MPVDILALDQRNTLALVARVQAAIVSPVPPPICEVVLFDPLRCSSVLPS